VQVPGRFGTVVPVRPGILKRQIALLLETYSIRAVKIGMLYSEQACTAVFEALKGYRGPRVVDPLVRASAGGVLLRVRARGIYRERLLKGAALVTPNLPEAHYWAGFRKSRSEEDLLEKLFERYGGAVLLKGGHSKPSRNGRVVDLLFDGRRIRRFERARVRGVSLHGSGCMLSAAIAAWLARGRGLTESVRRAEDFLTRCLRRPVLMGERDNLAVPPGA
jgi:hydroxymethylpyrimidine/phosphomethylpyrimidine kinase